MIRLAAFVDRATATKPNTSLALDVEAFRHEDGSRTRSWFRPQIYGIERTDGTGLLFAMQILGELLHAAAELSSS